MRLHWRPLRPGELDHELIWLLVSVAAAGLGMMWLALHFPWPRCTFLAVTGLPCFTCGATRAAVAFLNADIDAAWRFNPLISVLLAALLVFDLYAVTVLLSGAPRLRISLANRTAPRVIVAVAVLIVLLNWGYLLTTL